MEDQAVFHLSGDIDVLLSNRRARFYLQDYLKADFAKPGLIAIPYDKDAEQKKENTFSEIQEMLVKFGCEESLSETSQYVLTNFLDEKLRFEEFSNQAKRIWENKINTEDFTAFTEVLKGKMPARRLYDLQLLSSYHLTFAQNACNFSVPGAGKTSIVYAAYAYLNSLPQDHSKYVNKLFIVGPLSSFGPWEDEYQACFGKKGKIQRLSGGIAREERVRHLLSPSSAEISLISYQGISSSNEDIISYFKRPGNRVMMILDEAHKIKNTAKGLWATSVLNIAKYSASRVALSGTPIPNGYEDLYNLYNFIWPDRDVIKFNLRQLKEMSQNPTDYRISELANNISPFFIRITKKDLMKYMNLPPAIENPPVKVKMGKYQRQIYDALEKQYMPYFSKSVKTNSDAEAVLTKSRIIRLMQAATNPALLQKPIEEYYSELGVSHELFTDDSVLIDHIIKFKTIETPKKYVAIARLVSKIVGEGGKVVIWGIFIQSIKELQEYLSIQGIPSKLLIGETPVESDDPIQESMDTRESIVRQFNRDDSDFKVILANPFAVAESISLHKKCHNAIYLERNFNASHFLQSKDRIHRVGLKPEDKINYYYFISQRSIDETIHERLTEKEARMTAIIEGQEIPLINLNMDYEEDQQNDIKALIKNYVKRTIENR